MQKFYSIQNQSLMTNNFQKKSGKQTENRAFCTKKNKIEKVFKKILDLDMNFEVFLKFRTNSSGKVEKTFWIIIRSGKLRESPEFNSSVFKSDSLRGAANAALIGAHRIVDNSRKDIA